MNATMSKLSLILSVLSIAAASAAAADDDETPGKWWRDIHQRMSYSELKFYFGVHSANGVDSNTYEVAHVIERHSVEKRSGTQTGWSN